MRQWKIWKILERNGGFKGNSRTNSNDGCSIVMLDYWRLDRILFWIDRIWSCHELSSTLNFVLVAYIIVCTVYISMCIYIYIYMHISCME